MVIDPSVVAYKDKREPKNQPSGYVARTRTRTRARYGHGHEDTAIFEK